MAAHPRAHGAAEPESLGRDCAAANSEQNLPTDEWVAKSTGPKAHPADQRARPDPTDARFERDVEEPEDESRADRFAKAGDKHPGLVLGVPRVVRGDQPR